MANPAGESKDEALKLDFDRRVMLQFRGSVVTSDAGLLAYRELDDAHAQPAPKVQNVASSMACSPTARAGLTSSRGYRQRAFVPRRRRIH